MNKRETIEYEIKARQALVDADTERINELQAKLKALDEPVLEQGDYNIEKGLIAHVLAPLESDVNLLWRDSRGLCPGQYLSPVSVKKDGNFYKDLSRLSEPLEEFEKETWGGNFFVAKLCGNDKIELKIRTTGENFELAAATFDETKEIIDELTRVYHTARKKSEKS